MSRRPLFTFRTLAALCAALVGFSTAYGGQEPESLRLVPTEFTLSGPAASQALLLETFAGENATGQVTADVSYTISDPAVLKVEDGVALPLANGKATVTATAGGRQATAEVTVAAMDQSFAWSFRNHVESVLSKSGCNSGACHGALAGRAKKASSSRWARLTRWPTTSTSRDRRGPAASC
jgi:hypothetical protein